MAKRSADIARRKKALTALAKISGTAPDAEGFFASDGRYVVLHYDLLNINKADAPVNRSAAYTTIEQTIAAQSGIELGGSVYAAQLAAGETAVACAVRLWNAVAAATSGSLIEGDVFYLHYSGDKTNQLACIAQMVATGKTSLSTLKPPAAKTGP